MKLDRVLNVVMFVALAILYVLHFSGNTSETPVPAQVNNETEVGDSTETAPLVVVDTAVADSIINSPELLEASALKIAYVNIEFLNGNYKYVKDAERALIRKSEAETKRLKSEAEKLQNEYRMFIENVQAGLVNQQDAMQTEQVFQQQQMKLMQEEQQVAVALEEKRQSSSLKVIENVSDYLNRYADEFGFDVILAYSQSSGVLYARKKFDITNEVVKGLNAEYNKK